MLIPSVAGDWWHVAGNPDLGELTGPKQEPVDFAVWQAEDGAWQLWSCVRNTSCGGHTRLFHGWEAESLTDRDWRPSGIKMMAEPGLGEAVGGLLSPYVIKVRDRYEMLYGDWGTMCAATSTDGKTFERVTDADGRIGLFSEGPEAHTRDPVVLRVADAFHCYYTAAPAGKGAVYCRTSPDLRRWSGPKVVASGGRGGHGSCSAQSPFVLYHEEAEAFYLFRMEGYASEGRTSVYCSDDPFDFGLDSDRCFVCQMAAAAAEIVAYEGEFLIAALMPGLNGIRMARLAW